MPGSVTNSAPTINDRPSLTLCADDYGLAPGIGAAIRDLIAQGRLQATGCMTAGPHWPEQAALLKPLDGMAEIGLHLTLTDQTPAGPMPDLAPDGKLPPLGALLKRALLRKLNPAEIRAELHRQLDLFEAAFGRTPDFIDGHHHVHQLPIIGDAVIEAVKTRLTAHAWVRSCWENPAAPALRGVSVLRALVISELGREFRRKLDRAGIRRNASFRGVYDFSGRVPFDALFRRFTADCGPATLMMVHPGLVDDHLRAVDGLTDQRRVEYEYLASDAPVFHLAAAGVALTKLPA